MISIIVPVYNAEKYLIQCVESILNQTYKDYELILIDDGSTDKSPEICDSYKGENILVIHKRNEGVSAARNTGLEMANGDYIAFIDSDDIVSPEYLEYLYCHIEDVDIACCNYIIDGKKGKEYKDAIIDSFNALDCYSEYYFTAVWGKLFRRSAIGDIRFRTDIYYSEDTLFYTEVLIKANKIYFGNKAFYTYIQNENGAIRRHDINKWYTDFKARLEMVDMYSNYPSLKKKAICRAVSSAVTIKTIGLKSGANNRNDEEMKIINKYIKHFFWLYISAKYVPLRDRLYCVIVRIKPLYYLLRK